MYYITNVGLIKAKMVVLKPIVLPSFISASTLQYLKSSLYTHDSLYSHILFMYTSLPFYINDHIPMITTVVCCISLNEMISISSYTTFLKNCGGHKVLKTAICLKCVVGGSKDIFPVK